MSQNNMFSDNWPIFKMMNEHKKHVTFHDLLSVILAQGPC